MSITRVRLVDGDTELVLHDTPWLRLDLFLQNLQIGSPAVREVVDDRTDADGTDDETAYHGARAVSVDVRVLDTPGQLADQLTGFMHPRRRPYLCIVDDEWGGERRLRLRASQWTNPLDTMSGRLRDVQLQWRAPDGVWEATDEVAVGVNADSGVEAGRTYDLVFPRDYGTTGSVGAYQLVNPGTAWADYRVRLYGPAVGPRWTDDQTGATIAFTPEMSLAAGEYVELDTRERSAVLNSDASLSRLHLVDFEVTTWWQLRPGTNVVRYNPLAEAGAGTRAELVYRPTWL